MVTENGLQNRLEIEKLSFWTQFEALEDHSFKRLPISSEIGETQLLLFDLIGKGDK